MLRTASRPKLLVLARHGESIVNALKEGEPFCPNRKVANMLRKIPTHLAPLTDLGRAQAIDLGKRLVEEFGTFDVAIHSGYERTFETAILAIHQIKEERPPLISDFRLRERESGYGYAMTRSEFDRHFPYVEWYWKNTGWFYAVPPGGENCARVRERALQATEEICEKYAGQSVVIFGHGRTTQTLQTDLDGLPFNTPKCPVRHLENCEYVTYRF